MKPAHSAHLTEQTDAAAAITIVGLGPGALADITLAGWRALTSGRLVTLRTAHHPCVAELAEQVAFETFDHLYEAHAQFADVYAQIADRVLALAQQSGGVVYAVPGHPMVGETTTALIQARAKKAGLQVEIVGATSFVEPVCTALGLDPMNGCQLVDAMLLAQQHYPRVETGMPLLVGQVFARWLASDIKLTLLNAYPADHPVTVVRAAGSADQQVNTLPLHELDHRDDFDHLTTLYAPPLADGGSFTALQEIVAHLRAPDGCPWDREQTLASLRGDLLSECAEVLEAIDADVDYAESADTDNLGDGDARITANIVEELGDLLLLPAMLVQIASEEERFQMADVTRGIVQKLIRRHPHVFENVAVDGVSEVLTNWDAIKAAEKAAKGLPPPGPLDGVPAALPALEKARELQSKAAKAGLLDRMQEAQGVVEQMQRVVSTPTAHELGNLLWRIVALAKAHDLNAEDALRTYVMYFKSRHQ
ncbi:MAG: MazG family protein [Caldilineaceae bacterium]